MTTLAIWAHSQNCSMKNKGSSAKEGADVRCWTEVERDTNGNAVLKTSPGVCLPDIQWFQPTSSSGGAAATSYSNQDSPRGLVSKHSNLAKVTLPAGTCSVTLELAGSLVGSVNEAFGVHVSNQNFDLTNIDLPVRDNPNGPGRAQWNEHSWNVGYMAAMRLFPHTRIPRNLQAGTTHANIEGLGTGDADAQQVDAEGYLLDSEDAHRLLTNGGPFYQFRSVDWFNSDRNPPEAEYENEYGFDVAMDSGGWAINDGAPVRGSVPHILSYGRYGYDTGESKTIGTIPQGLDEKTARGTALETDLSLCSRTVWNLVSVTERNIRTTQQQQGTQHVR